MRKNCKEVSGIRPSALRSSTVRLRPNRLRLEELQVSGCRYRAFGSEVFDREAQTESAQARRVAGIFGQSLIEVVISIALAAILAISLITTTLVTQRTSQSARNNTEATKLAQEGVERLRVFRDRQGYDLLVERDCYTLEYSVPGDIDSLQLYTAKCMSEPKGELIQPTNEASFYRTYAIKNTASANTKLVTVTIKWEESSGQKLVKNETFLSQWESF